MSTVYEMQMSGLALIQTLTLLAICAGIWRLK